MGFDAVHYNSPQDIQPTSWWRRPRFWTDRCEIALGRILARSCCKEEANFGRRPVDFVNQEWWYHWHQPANSIGKVQQWHGNSGAVIRCWAYYRRYGRSLKTMSEHAVLNANYLRHRIIEEAEKVGVRHLFADGAPVDVVKHEFTISNGSYEGRMWDRCNGYRKGFARQGLHGSNGLLPAYRS